MCQGDERKTFNGIVPRPNVDAILQSLCIKNDVLSARLIRQVYQIRSQIPRFKIDKDLDREYNMFDSGEMFVVSCMRSS